MPDPTKSSEHKSSDKALEEEVSRLRTQVRDLQAELSNRSTKSEQSQGRFGTDKSRYGGEDYDRDRPYAERSEEDRDIGREASDVVRETSDVMQDLPARAMDEASNLLRSFAFAYLEQLRLTANLAISFADEVFQRNRPGESGRSSGRSRERESGRGRHREEDYGGGRREQREYGGDQYRQGSYRSAQREDREYSTRQREARDYEDERDENRQRSGGYQHRDRAYGREGERSEERSVGRRSERSASPSGLAGDLLRDMYSSLISTVDETLNIPRRTVDRFYETYSEGEELRSSGQDREESRVERGSRREEREPYDSDRELSKTDREKSRSDQEVDRAKREASKSARESARAILESAKPEP